MKSGTDEETDHTLCRGQNKAGGAGQEDGGWFMEEAAQGGDLSNGRLLKDGKREGDCRIHWF